MPTFVVKRFKFVSLFVAILVIFLFTHSALAGTETQITSSSWNQQYPSISGNKIVWQEYRSGSSNIYMYDLATNTETEISHGQGSGSYAPDIDGNRIVWVDYRNGGNNAAIYMYDLLTHTETMIASGSGVYYDPQISGNKVVWFDVRNGGANSDVYMYDLATHTEIPICTAPKTQYYSKISGDKIVWQDYRNGNPNIYMYDLAANTETRITTNMAGQEHPEIFGNMIVWQDYRNARDNDNSDVYSYDLVTQVETRVTTDNRWQGSPIISAGRIFWVDNRNGNGDVYMYSLADQVEVRLTTSSVQARNLQISGTKLIWEDWRSGNADIYMYDLNPNVAPTAQISPVSMVTSGQPVSFDGSGSDDSDGTIVSYAWDFGDGSIGSGVIASHVYAAAGTYQVTLTVVDNHGATSTAGISVKVNAVPVAVIAPIQTVIIGEATRLDGSGSYDSDGMIVLYQWDFGDGSTGSSAIINHAYAVAGTYQATLMVTDDDNAAGIISRMAIVQTPIQALNDLIALVQSMNLARGISNSLDSKLQNASAALSAENANDREDAVNKLEAFINATQAQSGNQLTVEQASQLIAAAQRIISVL